MKLRKEHVIAVLAVGLVLAAVGSAYQFYYKQRLAGYAENLQALQKLDDVLKDLEVKFESKDPEGLITYWRNQVQPLAEKVVQRAQFFNTGDALQIDPIPEGKLLRFYYTDEFVKMLNELRQDAVSRTPSCPYPDASTFGAPRPEELEGRTVTEQQVKQWLRLIKFGSAAVRMLMDAKALSIYDVQVWPARSEDMLWMRTVGLSFVMRYADLVAFIDKLQLENRYFNINAISIQNRYLRWPTEPPVEVQMLLTQADYNTTAGAQAAPQAPGAPGPTAPLNPLMARFMQGGGPQGPGEPGPPGSEVSSQNLTDAQRLAEQGFGRRTGRVPLEEQTRWKKVRNWLRNHWLWPF